GAYLGNDRHRPAGLPASLESLGVGLDQRLEPLLLAQRLVEAHVALARLCRAAFRLMGSAWREGFRCGHAAPGCLGFRPSPQPCGSVMPAPGSGYGDSLAHTGSCLASGKFV